MKKQYFYEAKVINVVDGDTIDCLVDLGFYVSVEMRFRLNGVDTAELHSKDEAKRALAKQAKDFVTSTILDKEVLLQTFKQDKYGRYLCEVFIGDNSVNRRLIEMGLAESYDGGKRNV